MTFASATAVGDDAVYLLPGRKLLAQQPDRHLRDGHGVAGVDTEVGSHRRVGFVTAVVHRHVGQRQGPRLSDVDRPRVHHHRRGKCRRTLRP